MNGGNTLSEDVIFVTNVTSGYYENCWSIRTERKTGVLYGNKLCQHKWYLFDKVYASHFEATATIFTGSRAVLKILSPPSLYTGSLQLVQEIEAVHYQVTSAGHNNEFHWISTLSGIEGNELNHVAAATRTRHSLRKISIPFSLRHMSCTRKCFGRIKVVAIRPVQRGHSFNFKRSSYLYPDMPKKSDTDFVYVFPAQMHMYLLRLHSATSSNYEVCQDTISGAVALDTLRSVSHWFEVLLFYSVLGSN